MARSRCSRCCSYSGTESGPLLESNRTASCRMKSKPWACTGHSYKWISTSLQGVAERHTVWPKSTMHAQGGCARRCMNWACAGRKHAQWTENECHFCKTGVHGCSRLFTVHGSVNIYKNRGFLSSRFTGSRLFTGTQISARTRFVEFLHGYQ